MKLFVTVCSVIKPSTMYKYSWGVVSVARYHSQRKRLKYVFMCIVYVVPGALGWMIEYYVVTVMTSQSGMDNAKDQRPFVTEMETECFQTVIHD